MLDHLDALQHQAAGICHRTIPSIESHRHAAAIGLTYRLLDEGHGDLKVFYSRICDYCCQDIVSPTRMLSDPARALKLNNPVTFIKSLNNSFHRS